MIIHLGSIKKIYPLLSGILLWDFDEVVQNCVLPCEDYKRRVKLDAVYRW